MTGTYIHLRIKDGRTLIDGSSECFFGHRLSCPDDGATQGIFAKWAWDGARLDVTNCRYGMIPLYYFERPGEICVSDSIRQLIRRGASVELDYDALSVFLRFGWFLGEDTPFKAIRAVPPKAMFCWRAGNLEVSGDYTIRMPDYRSRNSALDSFNQLFRQSIERRHPGNTPFVLPLSGGRDSRHILLELLHQGAIPQYCLTARHIPPRSNEDARIAAMLAQSFALKHEVLDQPKTRLRSETEKNEQTEFGAIEHAWAITISEHCRDRVQLMYDGIGGDMLTNGTGAVKLTKDNLELFEAGRFEDLATATCRCTSEIALARMLRGEWYRKLGRDRAIARIGVELRRHAGAPNPVGSFHFWNRMRRGVAAYSFGLLRDVRLLYCPYLDHDVYDLLASLPASTVLDGQFHTDAIHRGYREYRGIPFEDKSAPPRDSRSFYRRYAHDLVRFLMRRYGSRIVDTSFLIPRMLRWSLSRRPSGLAWMEPQYAIYLLQLEDLYRDT